MGRASRKRTLQIRKKRSWGKIIASGIAGIIALLVILGIVTWILISSYLSGSDFKSLLEKQAAKVMKVDAVSLAPLEWGGSSLSTKSMNATGSQLLQNLEITNLEAEVNRSAILDRHFEISNIQADSVSVRLAKHGFLSPQSSGTSITPSPRVETPIPSEKSDLTKIPEPPSSLPSSPNEENKSVNWWKERFMPTKYSLRKASINKINLTYEDGDNSYSLRNVRLTITPEHNNHEYRLLLQGGQFSLPSQFAARGTIQSALLRYRADRISASDFRITLDNGGYLDIEGEYSIPDGLWWTSLVARNIQCSDVLPIDWKQKITGVIQATARVREELPGQPEASGSLKIDKGVLTALPILDTMAAFSGTSKFRHIQFNKAEANYEYTGKTIYIKDIILSSEGLLRIEGALTIDANKNINGQLKLGVLPGILSNIPGAEEKIFLSANNGGKMGLLWTNVNLTGTVEHPREDLSARLITAAGERLFSSLPGQAEKALLFSGTLAEKLLGKRNKDVTGQQPDNQPSPDNQKPASDDGDKPVEKTINSLIKAGKLLGL